MARGVKIVNQSLDDDGEREAKVRWAAMKMRGSFIYLLDLDHISVVTSNSLAEGLDTVKATGAYRKGTEPMIPSRFYQVLFQGPLSRPSSLWL